MRSYTFEFNNGGGISDHYFENDAAAQAWAVDMLRLRGYDGEELICGDWDADGLGADDKQCYRMLFWACETDAENDAGQNAIGQLCK